MSEIRGTSRVFKKLKMVSREVDLQVRSAIQRNTEQMLDEARKNVPIDTGELQRSGDKDTTNPYIGKVFFGGPQAPYAPYVEFGTGEGFSTDPSFIQEADYFIFKKDGKKNEERSKLAAWCEISEAPESVYTLNL